MSDHVRTPVVRPPSAGSPDSRSPEPVGDVAPARGADLLVESLILAGVTTLFGVPGDTGVVFYDALSLRTGRIRHVLARDERHAAAMADGYARSSHQVGVVEVSSGGGTTYVVGGLGEAYASATPMLVVTSDIHRSSHGTGALTEIDQRALFSAVTKQVLVPESAEEIPAAVSTALDVATSGRPGPVALVIAEDILDEVVGAAAELLARSDLRPDAISVPASRPTADEDRIRTAAAALGVARHPAFLVGAGVHYSQAYDRLAGLAEQLGAGVATSIHGKGAIADTNDWALGVAGNNGGGPLAAEELTAADVVVVVGSRANATDTDSFTAPARSATVIAVDVDPSTICRNYPDAIGLAGDAQTVLGQLSEAVPAVARGIVDDRRRRVAEHRSALHDGASGSGAGAAMPAAGDRLPVDDVIDTLVSVFTRDGDQLPIVVADPGAPTPAVADRFPVIRAGRNFVVPRGHGPMGFAIAGAIGVAVAHPGRPVLALTADGSFAMSCGELETITRLQLPIIAVQLTNHSLGWIKMLQHLYQDGRYFGVDPGPIDAVAVARACGLRAERPTTLEALATQVETALADRRPLYLDVEVPHMIDVVPQVPAWHRALAGDRIRPVY